MAGVTQCSLPPRLSSKPFDVPLNRVWFYKKVGMIGGITEIRFHYLVFLFRLEAFLRVGDERPKVSFLEKRNKRQKINRVGR